MAQPNILFIMVDQMAHDVIKALGHPTVLTPNLDALIRGGVSFTNAYCNSPICASSRAALMTGRLVRYTGAFDNGAELPASVPTLLHHLNRTGYSTVLSGKMHFVGPDQLHGFKERLTADISPAGFELTPDWRRGAYANPGTSVRRLTWSGVRDWTFQLAYDDEVLHCALARLRTLREEANPFFLCVSFSQPHEPFQITQPLWERYQEHDIPLPLVPARELAVLHPYDRWIQIHHEADCVRLSDEEIRLARRCYYAMLSYIDGLVGRLMDELSRLGLDDTLVVFTSDHGEMLGERGMWFKRTFYDGAAKVPLICYWPAVIAPARRSEVLSLVDLTATLLDLADVPEGAAWLEHLDGDSFRSLLMGEAGRWKDRAVLEYYGEGTVEPMLMLRKGRYKYVYVHDHAPLLFDLEADPLERADLAAEPAKQALCRVLKAELLAGLDVAALRERVLQSQRERLLVAATGANSLWRYEARRDVTRLYPRPKA